MFERPVQKRSAERLACPSARKGPKRGQELLPIDRVGIDLGTIDAGVFADKVVASITEGSAVPVWWRSLRRNERQAGTARSKSQGGVPSQRTLGG